jgi:hypothetical protein
LVGLKIYILGFSKIRIFLSLFNFISFKISLIEPKLEPKPMHP